jgi:hypothetical protein
MQNSRILFFSSITVAALALDACGGGGGGSAVSVSPTTPKILIAGKVSKFTGSDTIVHTFANPAPGQANYTEAYTFAQTTTVNLAAAGAPAPYDVNVTATYTASQAPAAGTQKESTTTDSFETQAGNGANLQVLLVAQNTSATGIDISGGLTGGGPYTLTTSTSTKFATPQTLGIYPLVTGATYAEPLARTVATTETDANPGGAGPALAYESSASQTFASGGGFTRTAQFTNAETSTLTESANGSAQLQETGPLFTLSETIGVPVAGATGYTIPVTFTRQPATLGATPAPSATPVASSAVDWYPGGALPAQPLSSETITVKGAATTLPAGCSGALAQPNTVEVDEKLTTLNVDGSAQTLTQQRFDSNGTNVCVLRTTTTNTYAVTTGLPLETSTETYTQILTNLTVPTAAAQAVGVRS